MNPLDRDEKVVPVGDINEKIDEILEAMRRTWHPTKVEMVEQLGEPELIDAPNDWVIRLWEKFTGKAYLSDDEVMKRYMAQEVAKEYYSSPLRFFMGL